MPKPVAHPRDPLHGITLEHIVTALAERHGWAEMGRRIPIRCFLFDPSVRSSLKFLRKTPWARSRVEDWFIIEQLDRESAESRPDMTAGVLNDLVYRADSEKGRLDVLLPTSAPRPWPVVIVVHGGGWREGSKAGIRFLGELLVGMGVAAVIPNYRLTVTDAFPAQEEDLLAVLQWVADHAGEHGFDIHRVGLAGASAGGHLAALIGVKVTRAGVVCPCTIRCILAVCGVADVARWSTEKPGYREYVEAFVGGPVEARLPVAREASPLTHVHALAPPLRCVHGALDDVVPVNQSEVLVEAFRAAGVAAELCVAPNDGHAMTTGGAGTEPLGGIDGFTAFFEKHLTLR